MTLKAPFPYFGGKSKIAGEVWQRFGDSQNYVEPFCGTAAVLLGRPSEPRIETVNDANCFIANFWRAIQCDPEAVAVFADWPVNEADLHARHRWLMLSESAAEFRERMKTDPDYFDAKVAGWWVWGASCWIGAGWCDGGRMFGRDGGASNKMPELDHHRGDAAATRAPDRRRPELSNGKGRGVTAALDQKRPALANSGRGDASASLENKRPRLTGWGGAGVHRQLPDLGGNDGASGKGIHASGLSRKMPNVTSGHGGGTGLHIKIPDVGKSSRGDATVKPILAWFDELAGRMRRVRVVCGDWKRVLTPAVTVGIGTTAVFLDPPYADTANRTKAIYSEDDSQVAHRVREWAIENGGNPAFRIALCGYDGEHEMPAAWECFEWHAQGGYANQKKSGQGFANRKRERIWFSPHCLTAHQQRLIA